MSFSGVASVVVLLACGAYCCLSLSGAQPSANHAGSESRLMGGDVAAAQQDGPVLLPFVCPVREAPAPAASPAILRHDQTPALAPPHPARIREGVNSLLPADVRIGSGRDAPEVDDLGRLARQHGDGARGCVHTSRLVQWRPRRVG